MYKIFFDTNSIFEEGKARSIREVFNSKIEDLINFLKTNGRLDDIEICIPKIVIEERLKHVSEKGEEKVESVNSIIKELKIGYEGSITEDWKKYLVEIKKDVEDFIKRNHIKILKTPDLKFKDILERAINKKKPFKNSDVGFKDTVIFLSILESALNDKNHNEYIFCTNDGGFDYDCKDEFMLRTGKEIKIIDKNKLHEELDSLLKLGLNLKEKEKRIKTLIIENKKEILDEINRKKLKQNFGENTFLVHIPVRLGIPLYSDVNENYEYEFNGVKDVYNIIKLEDDVYDACAEINVVPSNIIDNYRYLWHTKESAYYGLSKEINIKFSCNLKHGNIYNIEILNFMAI